MTRFPMILAVASASVIGLGGGAFAAASAPASTPAPGGLSWHDCADRPGAECGVIDVPLDWSAPSGTKIKLTVVRRKAADPAARVGTLLYNPGGPGGPAALLVRDYPTGSFSDELRRRFDIVGIDPRGVGESTPAVRCGLPVHDPAVSQFPKNRAGYDRLVASSTAVGRSCLTATGPLLGRLDTANVARDFDAVRAALGEEKISFFGKSYGSMLGAQYARLFPGRLRTMALDGAVDQGIPTSRLVTDAARAVEDSFGRFTAWCERTTTCALHGRDVGKVWDDLVATAERDTIGVQGGRPITAEELRYSAYAYLTLIPELAPELATAITQAEQGDARLFAAMRAQALDDPVSRAAYRSILCSDVDPRIRGYHDVRNRLRKVLKAAPHMRGTSEFWDMTVGCLGWPIAPARAPHASPIKGVPPVLVVGNTHDPATPLRWARSLSARIQGSGLLTNDGDGHTAYRVSACATRHIDTYLVTGDLPPAGTVCPAETP
ncbi:alpha/beta hydrolase [Spongiactinospora rosea]|uniref:Alpha/beta hydrolase n=1 Tax=Spongiactinospora rosea TaxID=2248750 RepID=A0A366LR08_9ACTN|nr:alpha/beta hydrolase [Spongiactinospora rosea]RBQ16341.1 alpha/beta hydrolase [Spongiactinospora rosea]